MGDSRDVLFCLHSVKNVVTSPLKLVDFTRKQFLTSFEKINDPDNMARRSTCQQSSGTGWQLPLLEGPVLCSSVHRGPHLVSFRHLHYLSGLCRHLLKTLTSWVLLRHVFSCYFFSVLHKDEWLLILEKYVQ